MAFYYSPFESNVGEDGVPRVCECTYLRVIGGPQFPKSSPYSSPFLDLVRWMLSVDVASRPFVHEVQMQVHALLEGREATGIPRSPPAPEPAPSGHDSGAPSPRHPKHRSRADSFHKKAFDAA